MAEKHYDLGNRLFFSFLDSYNQYSCAYFNGTSDLAQAQRDKMDLICRKLDIHEGDCILDIGVRVGRPGQVHGRKSPLYGYRLQHIR